MIKATKLSLHSLRSTKKSEIAIETTKNENENEIGKEIEIEIDRTTIVTVVIDNINGIKRCTKVLLTLNN